MKNKPLKITLGLLATLLVTLLVALTVLLNMDWNRAKPWLNTRASAALGRPFAIKGDLTLTWEKQYAGPETSGWKSAVPWPHLLAKEVHIGQSLEQSQAKLQAQPPLPTEKAVSAKNTTTDDATFAVIKEMSFR
jgi:hypothetical protein